MRGKGNICLGSILICSSYYLQPMYGSIKTSDCSLEHSSPSAALTRGPASNPPYQTSIDLVCGEQPLLTCAKVTCTVRQVNLAPLVTVKVVYNVTVLSGKLSGVLSVMFAVSSLFCAKCVAGRTKVVTSVQRSGRILTRYWDKGHLRFFLSRNIWQELHSRIVHRCCRGLWRL